VQAAAALGGAVAIQGDLHQGDSVPGRFMVTGSAGFIGSALSRRLLKDGAEVVGLDCLTDTYDPREKQRRIDELVGNPGYHHVAVDLAAPGLSEHLEGVEVVFHLAGRPGVRDSFAFYDKYLHDNVEATANLVAAARAADSVRRVVYASSSSVYGDAPLPLIETYQPRPISPYGRTKLAAERLCLEASGIGFEAVALRYFTVYGPGQRPDMAFRRFAEAALQGTPIEVYGDGNQSRDFTYVDDIVAATYAAAAAPAAGLAINVGGGSRVTIREVLALLGEITGRQLHIVQQDQARGDVRHTGADLTRARDLLHFSPATSLREGLTEEVRWLQSRLV
jgi:UDP-glucuronate 4-epimerase